jgi:flagellar biosynthesis/type III secretory pathway M-ring protein FliF/YscJ
MAMRMYILAFLVWQTLVRVSVGQILSNMSATAAEKGSLLYFYKYAFFNTELTVQLLVAGIVLVVFWTIWRGVRMLVRSNSQFSPQFS